MYESKAIVTEHFKRCDAIAASFSFRLFSAIYTVGLSNMLLLDNNNTLNGNLSKIIRMHGHFGGKNRSADKMKKKAEMTGAHRLSLVKLA